jgi:hypothetical protein
MSGSEELLNSEEIEVEGGDGAEAGEGGDNMEDYDEEDIAQMQKDLAKAEQQKAELEKLQKMQGGGGATPEKAGLNCCKYFSAISFFILMGARIMPNSER